MQRFIDGLTLFAIVGAAIIAVLLFFAFAIPVFACGVAGMLVIGGYNLIAVIVNAAIGKPEKA